MITKAVIAKTKTVRYVRDLDRIDMHDWRTQATHISAICDHGLQEQFDYPGGLTEIWVEITDKDPQDEEAMEIFDAEECSFRCQDERCFEGIRKYDLHSTFYMHIVSVIGSGKGWMRVWY